MLVIENQININDKHLNINVKRKLWLTIGNNWFKGMNTSINIFYILALIQRCVFVSVAYIWNTGRFASRSGFLVWFLWTSRFGYDCPQAWFFVENTLHWAHDFCRNVLSINCCDKKWKISIDTLQILLTAAKQFVSMKNYFFKKLSNRISNFKIELKLPNDNIIWQNYAELILQVHRIFFHVGIYCKNVEYVAGLRSIVQFNERNVHWKKIQINSLLFN